MLINETLPLIFFKKNYLLAKVFAKVVFLFRAIFLKSRGKFFGGKFFILLK